MGSDIIFESEKFDVQDLKYAEKIFKNYLLHTKYDYIIVMIACNINDSG